jgi:hypothetical protein
MRSPDTLLRAVREVLASAFGPDLDGSEHRGERISRFYLARIRDVVFEYLPGAPAPGGACEDCADLRARLRNIYHQTLTFNDPAAALRAVREASAPGAPAPVTAEDPALVLLGRIVKYAREDRAQTPRFTRLARVLVEAEAELARRGEPEARGEHA